MAKFSDALVTTLQGHFDAGDQPTSAQFDALILAIQEGIEEHDHDGTGDGDGITTLAGALTLDLANTRVGLNTLTPGVNVAGIAAYPGVLQHIQGEAAARASLIVQSDTQAEMILSDTGAGADDKLWVVQVKDDCWAVLPHKDDGSLSLDALVVTSYNEGGKVGLGTRTVPHGGTGAALLALEGTNASVAGPHVQFTTDADDHPLLQMMNYGHDAVYLAFDAYWDGGWKSSDPGSSYNIAKEGDLFKLQYDVAAAGAAVTWNDGLTLSTAGVIQMPNLAGVGVRAVVAAADGTLSAP